MSSGALISRKPRIRPPSLRVSGSLVTEEPKPASTIHQVSPNLFISGYEAAKNPDLLKSFNITHILNLAGESKCPNQFRSSYTYFSLRMPDNPKVDILFFIYFAVEIIREVLSNKGKILVHCVKGTSRAAAVILAYFILQGLTESEAYHQIIASHPNIDPNFGFVCQLKELCKAKDMRIFEYSPRYDMFVNSTSSQGCRIEVFENECTLTISPDSHLDERNKAFDSIRLWEKFNNAKAGIIYVN